MPTAPKTDRRLERGQRTKRKLLLAAMNLIGARGLDGFSAQALSREAGVSQSLLYHHFANLDGLIPGVAELLWQFIERMLGGPRPATLKGYLAKLGRLTLDPTFYSAAFARAGAELYRRSLTDGAIRKLMQALRQRGVDRLVGDLAAYAPTPAQKARVREAVELLLPLSDGLQLHLALFGDRRAAQRAWALASAQAEVHILKGSPPRRAA